MHTHKKTRIVGTMTGENEAGMPDKDKAVSASSSILSPNCDIFTYRHLFQQLEADLLTIFERKLSRHQRLQTDLGRPGIFDWPEAKVKQLHKEAVELKEELDVLLAVHDYLNGLTDFSIDSWGKLSEQVLTLETENAKLRTQYRSLSILICVIEQSLDDLLASVQHNENASEHE